VHGADPQAHDQAGQDQATAACPSGGYQEGEAGSGRREQEGDEGQDQVIVNRRARVEPQHGDEMHRPYAAAHGRRRRGQPGQTRAALMGPHLLEQVQRRPGREDGHQEGQAVEDGNDV